MIEPSQFVKLLQLNGVDFFTGVPDSLLKDICAYITDNIDGNHHIIAANEGGAVALATGHYLATGNIPLVYMQNSGIGNAVNPLLSLVDPDVYSIPMLLMVGWRGEPGIKDEPQHKKQGAVTCDLFDAMGIEWTIVPDSLEDFLVRLKGIIDSIKQSKKPHVLIIRKGVFSNWQLQKSSNTAFELSREQAIESLIKAFPKDAAIVSTTGMASRELYEIREKNGMGHEQDFLTVGSMGHASQIALGIALEKRGRTIVCLDGDGATLMHMGSLGINGSIAPINYFHVVLNNTAHDSVGGQPTVADTVCLIDIAKACKYKTVISISNREDILSFVSSKPEGPVFMEIKVNKGARKDLGRPKESPQINKELFMEFLDKRQSCN
jgi:phosphonopyruvate decarboxylase